MKNFSIAFLNVSELVDFTATSKIDTSKTLIQLFCAETDIKKLHDIQQYFRENYPLSALIGSTTDGIIDGTEVYTASKNVVTFTLFNDTILKTAIIKHKDCNNSSFQSGKRLAEKLLTDTSQAIISFADGITTNGEEFVKGISSVNESITLSGGLAADNGDLIKTYVFDKYEIVDSGCVGVSLNNLALSVSTKYTFDWKAVGKKLMVTKSVKNRIYTIDNIPVVEIYAKYFGYELANQLPQVGIEFPLIFEKNGVSVGRAVLSKHNDGSLTFAGNVPEGTLVQFGIGNIENILQSSNYHVAKILDDLKYEVEAVFVYSCMARRRFMGEDITQELNILKNIGHVSGFFTYGEFYHSDESNQLLNETMTLLALSEVKKPVVRKLKEITMHSNHHMVRVEHAVANLANTVSQELAELNESLEKRIEDNKEYIYRQAYFDKLTGLPNRLSLIERLKSSVGQSIILINIDEFTVINDFYGHMVGDKILQKLAITLRDLMDESGEAFKLPSDEYALIVDMSHEEELQNEKLKACIEKIEKTNFSIDGMLIHVSVTVASALINKNKTGFIHADMALKLAKKAGKEYMVFNEGLELTKQYGENISMVSVIKKAILSDCIVPYFQPLYNIKTEKIEKYEALVRLKKEDGEILAPYFFLEISQKIKLYPKITEIMIEKTFTYFKKNAIAFSINLAFSDVLNEQTRAFLFAKIAEFDIASQLSVEILETQENDDVDAVNQFTKDIYAVGANIAIDDFGSGYANFEHMTTIKSDFMKIDGSLIKNLDSDKNSRLIVETIILFAKKLNKKVVAEFVHSKEIYDIVKELGVDYAQGYYIGKPLAKTL